MKDTLEDVRALNRAYNAQPTDEARTVLASVQREYEAQRREARLAERLARTSAKAAEVRATILERLAKVGDSTGDLQVTTQIHAEYIMMAASAAGGFVAINLNVVTLPETRAALERRFDSVGYLLLADFSGGFAECVLGTVPRRLVANDLRARLASLATKAGDYWLVEADESGDVDHLIAWLDRVERMP